MTDDATAQGAKSPSIWIRLWPVYVIVAGLVLAWWLGLFDYLSLETLREQQEQLKAFVTGNLILSILLFVLCYAAVTAFMVPGALWVTIAGGLLFGLLGGSLATIAGATLGASALFFAARTSVGSALRERAGPFMKKMEAGFNESPRSYMFAMRLMPVVPFPVANIAPALLGAKYADYALTTALGIIPGVMAYTWVGHSLGASLDPSETQSLLGAAGNFLPAFAALGVVSLIPVIYKKIAGRRARQLQEAAR